MPIANMQELTVHELCEIYDAEHRFVEGQEEMIQMASDQDLQSSIHQHLEQTRGHIRNLEQVFSQLGEEPRRETNAVAQGLVSEAQEGIQEAQNDAIRDCAIVAAVMKVEHFEMGSYRGLITGAEQMGQQEVANLLSENLREEEETAQIAEQSAPELIQKAMGQEGQQEEEEEEKGLVDKAKDRLMGE
jgi:ferritin-like metal-binding protein YciE